MTQEQFEALGIEKSLAKKAAEESKKELENYVAKETFDATEQKRKQLETSVQERETQLEELKASAGDNAALKQQIADLQAQNKQKDLDNQNPCLMINGEKLEVNADAPTMMKVINVTRNGGTSEENMNELYELVFPEKSRKVIDSLKLLVPDWMTVIQEAIKLITGDITGQGER